ncbi:MAG: hypothetical protein ACR2JS_02445 [Candidatus Nanopelagicales bacterium]
MNRQKFDRVVSISGLVMAVVIAAAGALLLWGGTFAHSTVTEELTSQKISFATDAAELPPELASYAGVAVVDGPTAQAYSDLVAVHMQGIGGGKTYSEVSGEWIAGGMKDPELAQTRTTLFMGESIRGMLLNAYAFWTIGTVAIIAAWVAFAAALVLLVLALLGFKHSKSAAA